MGARLLSKRVGSAEVALGAMSFLFRSGGSFVLPLEVLLVLFNSVTFRPEDLFDEAVGVGVASSLEIAAMNSSLRLFVHWLIS